MTSFDWTRALQAEPPRDRDLAALAAGGEVNVYGTGMAAREVIAALAGRGLRVRHLVDGNTRRTEVDGIPVRRPDDPAIPREERAGRPLLIGIFNREVDIPALREKLNAAGWSWTIDFVDLHAAWPRTFVDHYWLTARAFYGAHAGPIAEADALWADNASRDLYRAILHFRLTGSRERLPAPSASPQYFCADVPAWKTPLRMIDVGAFDGDTVRALAQSGRPAAAVVSLEPDPANYAKLARMREEKPPFDFAAWPCGAWSETTQLRFKRGVGEASAIGSEGDTTIQCVALDDALPDFRPTLIKLDIEGAEPEALRGARGIIQRDRPGLAICVYHRPAHLWEIPLLLAGWVPGHRLFLRSHAYSGFDLVLYAVAP
jgi:FkbM family methyltransferase